MSLAHDVLHLDPTARPQAGESSEVRVQRILADRWISFPHTDAILGRMKKLLSMPRRGRMPCLLVTASSGMGKTMLVKRFLRDHPSGLLPGQSVSATPVIAIQMTNVSSPRRICLRILDELRAPLGRMQNTDILETVTINILREMGLRMIIVDELQDVLLGSPREQRLCMNFLKLLGNALQVSIVAFGVEEAAIAIAIDPQLQLRFQRVDIAQWQDGPALRSVLAAFERTLPLRRPSRLNTPSVAKLLLRESGGLTVGIVGMLCDAAASAIECGEERVTEASLRSSIAASRAITGPSGDGAFDD